MPVVRDEDLADTVVQTVLGDDSRGEDCDNRLLLSNGFSTQRHVIGRKARGMLAGTFNT
jgi:hypothetical protein